MNHVYSLGGNYRKSVLEKDLIYPRGKVSAFSCNILHTLAEVKIWIECCLALLQSATLCWHLILYGSIALYINASEQSWIWHQKANKRTRASSLQKPRLGLTLHIKDPKWIPQLHLEYSQGYHLLIFPKLQHQTSLLDGSYDRHKVGKTCLGLRHSLHLIEMTKILPGYCFYPSINH